MLIELRAGPHTLAAENGVLTAQEVQVLQDLEMLSRQSDQERREILARAHADATACINSAAEEAESMIEIARAEADPQAITAAAQAKALKILERARKDAKNLRAQAREEGRLEGLHQATEAWHQQQMELTLEHQNGLDAMHDKLVGIVMSAVERIVAAEPREALFQRAARNVQHLSRGAMALTLRVCANDHAPAHAALESLKSLQALGLQLDVVVDSSLKPGACVFESELGVLDASLDVQLASLRTAMSRAVQKAGLTQELCES